MFCRHRCLVYLLGLVLLIMVAAQRPSQAAPRMALEQIQMDEVCGLFSPRESKVGGGTIRIRASKVSVEGESRILAEAEGQAKGGEVCLFTDTFKAKDRGRISVSNTGHGDAGRLLLVANQTVDLEGDSKLEAISFGPGPGSDILVFTELYEAQSNSQIVTNNFDNGDAGELMLISDRVLLNDNSDLRSNDQGPGAGGHITISSNQFVARKGSDIQVEDEGIGMGGNIDILAQEIAILEGGSDIDAQVFQDQGGDISIVAGKLVVVPPSQICPGANGELSIVAFDVLGSPTPTQACVLEDLRER